MSGSAPRATASTAARPRFVKCFRVLSRGRKCNRPVISVAPSHSVTVAITWNFFIYLFFAGKQQFSFLVSRASAVRRPSHRIPRTLRISEAARCADPLRDYIIMRRHCTLGSVHTVAVGCKRVAHGWTSVSCISSREALLSALMTDSEDPPVIRRGTDSLAANAVSWPRLCLRRRFVSHFGVRAMRWKHATSIARIRVGILSEEVTFERSLCFKWKIKIHHMHWEELWKCHNALKRDFALKKSRQDIVCYPKQCNNKSVNIQWWLTGITVTDDSLVVLQ